MKFARTTFRKGKNETPFGRTDRPAVDSRPTGDPPMPPGRNGGDRHPCPLPAGLANWFHARGWELHPHQQRLIEVAEEASVILVAPTGGGKTLAGFLPSLIALESGDFNGLHTLYVSPLKALASDIHRNLQQPVDDLRLPVRIEVRTGDTPQSRRVRQRADPPHMLLTTPESLALMLSHPDAEHIFGTLQRVIVDEIHALAESRRGDQLALCLSRLRSLAPSMRRVGLSATVKDPDALGHFLSAAPEPCTIIHADSGLPPDISVLMTDETPPWSGAGALYSIPAVIDEIRGSRTTLVFINTRAQCEIYFHALWQANRDNLPIALHHGALSREAREKVESAMVEGRLRAIVCTGTLDLGIDWGDVDLVIQIGAPKNVQRLVQRIGRSNHTYNAPSRAILVPANRFEVFECQAALEAAAAHDLDGEPRGAGAGDVLCQHIFIRAAAGPFDADELFREIRAAGPFSNVTRQEFDACLDYCATGGYAFRAYDRWQRLRRRPDGMWELRDPRRARSVRMNVGTIIEEDMMSVRLGRRGGRPLGRVEEAFAATLSEGDTFLMGGKIVRFDRLREMTVEVSRSQARRPRIAVFSGTKFATSTLLCNRVIALLQPESPPGVPDHAINWIRRQREISRVPMSGRLLIESFPHGNLECTCIYGFAGKNAHQTLGLLLTRRMEIHDLRPVGFVTTDYAVLLWSLAKVTDAHMLMSPESIRAGFEDWLSGNAVMKRTFKTVATISGLIERNIPGSTRKTGRQTAVSSDILYDTLRKYDPDHLLLSLTREEAMRGIVDFSRIEDMFSRVSGQIDHVFVPHVTPLAAPLLLEVGRVPISASGEEELLSETAGELMKKAGLDQSMNAQ